MSDESHVTKAELGQDRRTRLCAVFLGTFVLAWVGGLIFRLTEEPRARKALDRHLQSKYYPKRGDDSWFWEKPSAEFTFCSGPTFSYSWNIAEGKRWSTGSFMLEAVVEGSRTSVGSVGYLNTELLWRHKTVFVVTRTWNHWKVEEHSTVILPLK